MLQAFCLLFPILYFMLPLLSVSTANSNVYVQCSQLNFTSMTPYESNVNSLFASLIDSASLYNYNKFETSPQIDTVYGLFQCRGDLSSPNCKDCVANSISQLKTACPMSKGGEIQLDGCFVKYDDTSFFGGQNKMEVCRKCSPSIGYNSDVMSRIDSALAYLVGGNGQYFRGSDFGSVQGVAQCVQDLSLSDCQDCLSEASGRLRSECETSTWGDMYLGKCYIRYAEQGNLNIPDVNSNPNFKKRSGKGSKKLGWVLGIIGSFFGGGIVFSVTTIVVCACNCCNTNVYINKIKKLKFKKKAVEKERDSAKSEAKTAKEKAAKLEKEKEECMKKCAPCVQPIIPPPPPPCSYLAVPAPCTYGPPTNPNTCFYL